MDKQHEILIDELIKFLSGGSAHASLDEALDNLPAKLRSVKPDKLPYSIWQLVEHIRIAQWDMLKFSQNEKHTSPTWPDEYWVKETAPANEDEWKNSLKQIDNDRKEFIKLLKTGDIYKAIPHGDGQSILLEALQIADHNAYHTAEIIVIRRLLGAWKS
ncbi:DinB family protein [Mucilaginibacter sp. McL0603]|uniref:DinB family protein n=1 Tax=Mucilaginibacter sp. McL0603 TaxID=3415670 RepID=UPI003CF8F522